MTILEIENPYPRYGLAFALFNSGINTRSPNGDDCFQEPNWQKILVNALESGLRHFRMETDNHAEIEETLNYRPISLETLKNAMA